jgi:hypothetical protein
LRGLNYLLVCEVAMGRMQRLEDIHTFAAAVECDSVLYRKETWPAGTRLKSVF